MARRASTIALLLVACRPARTPEPNKDSHYPLQLGQQWTYDTRVYGGQGGRSATSVTAVCRIQLDEDGDLLHLVSTCSEEQLVQAQLVYQLGAEIVEPVLFNAQGEPRTRDPPVTIARLHMLVGDQWRWSGTSGDADERVDLYRVANRSRVRTEAGGRAGQGGRRRPVPGRGRPTGPDRAGAHAQGAERSAGRPAPVLLEGAGERAMSAATSFAILTE
jgi:hypothetical protein